MSAGFLPTKDRDNSEQIPMVESFYLQAEIDSGSMKLSVKAWRKVKIYRFGYRRKDVDQEWTIAMSTKSRCKIAGLEIRTEYEFRVCYVGARGSSAYSPVKSSYVY